MLAGRQLGEVAQRDVEGHPRARDERGRRDDDLVLHVVAGIRRREVAGPVADAFEEAARFPGLAAAVDSVRSVVHQLYPKLRRSGHLPQQGEGNPGCDRSEEQVGPATAPARARPVGHEAHDRIRDRVAQARKAAEEAHRSRIHAQHQNQQHAHAADGRREQVVDEAADPVRDLVRKRDAVFGGRPAALAHGLLPWLRDAGHDLRAPRRARSSSCYPALCTRTQSTNIDCGNRVASLGGPTKFPPTATLRRMKKGLSKTHSPGTSSRRTTL